MITTLEDVKNTLLRNIKEAFENGNCSRIEKILLVRDTMGKITLVFSCHTNEEEYINGLVRSFFLYEYLGEQESFEVWLGGYFINDLEINDLFKEAIRPDKMVLDRVYWHEEALHLEDWTTLKERSSKQIKDNKTKVISFCHYKNGIGNTTLCAIMALELSKKDKKVVVIDTDFYTYGLTQLFNPVGEYDYCNGFLDLLLFPYNDQSASQREKFDFSFHEDFLFKVMGHYSTFIMPAVKVSNNDGGVNEYKQKLARAPFLGEIRRGIACLIKLIKESINPDYILIDLETGINDIGGIVARHTDYFCFVGGVDKQSQIGLKFLVDHSLILYKKDNDYISNMIFIHSSSKSKINKAELNHFNNMVADSISDYGDDYLKVIEQEYVFRIPHQSRLRVLVNEEGIINGYTKDEGLTKIDCYEGVAEKIYNLP